VVVLLYPIGRILARMGLSPIWSVVAVFPILNLFGLWLLAFIDWPARPAGGSAGRLPGNVK
jgi:hypothetical protein